MDVGVPYTFRLHLPPENVILICPQRRRDELREGFARLKDALPQSNQRSSKASLLDRCESAPVMIRDARADSVLAVQYIRDIDFANRYLSTENDALKAELAEVRQ